MKKLFGILGGLVRWGLGLALLLTVVVFLGEYLSDASRYSDQDPERGALALGDEVKVDFGDKIREIRYLDQGWDAAQSLWYYNVTQGSDLLPYDFFMALEQPDSEEPFRAASNMDAYRYLPQKPTSSNPDGLPVGIVKDTYESKAYIGFTCAACHTAQINYEGTGIRIDGGPSAADMVGFLKGLNRALNATRGPDDENNAKLDRFVKNVLARGNYGSADDVKRDLDNFILRLLMYNRINDSETAYGFARLDAFGRIFNRVLEHLATRAELKGLLGKLRLTPEEVNQVLPDKKGVLTTEARDAIGREAVRVLVEKHKMTEEQAIDEITRMVRENIFVPADAPVSYPFLWDIPQHDYVQWNGILGNSGITPLGRNTGEVIGVFATLDWQETSHWNLGAWITGQGLQGRESVEFKSSVNVRNLRRVEQQLKNLTSPVWPEDILPALDRKSVARGRVLFDEYCVSCHHHIDRASPSRRVVAFMSSVESIKTDPKMADNSVDAKGPSGFVENLYVGAGPGDLLIQPIAPVAALLTKATTGVVATPDPDTIWGLRWVNWAYDMFSSYINNEIKSSMKRGDYAPDTTVDPYASLRAYKGRPLNGIWATAPYLHNGSVPTLYDLLLPKKRKGDAEGEYRPDRFMVGSREFDPKRVGFVTEGFDGFEFVTICPGDDNDAEDSEFERACPGNDNGGHEYAAGHTPQPGGKILEALDQRDRWDLVEYMKSL